MNLVDRFMKKVEKTEACWNWTARRTPQGYGRFGVNGVNKLAHRVSYEMFKAPITDGLHVLHRCDNPSCVNPDHLWLGTNAENVADKVAKGREPSHIGESNNHSKLTAQDVLAIREAASRGANQYRLAEQYEIAQAHVSSIVRRKAWSHL